MGRNQFHNIKDEIPNSKNCGRNSYSLPRFKGRIIHNLELKYGFIQFNDEQIAGRRAIINLIFIFKLKTTRILFEGDFGICPI